jgi:hypothetical protein
VIKTDISQTKGWHQGLEAPIRSPLRIEESPLSPLRMGKSPLRPLRMGKIAAFAALYGKFDFIGKMKNEIALSNIQYFGTQLIDFNISNNDLNQICKKNNVFLRFYFFSLANFLFWSTIHL